MYCYPGPPTRLRLWPSTAALKVPVLVTCAKVAQPAGTAALFAYAVSQGYPSHAMGSGEAERALRAGRYVWGLASPVLRRQGPVVSIVAQECRWKLEVWGANCASLPGQPGAIGGT